MPSIVTKYSQKELVAAFRELRDASREVLRVRTAELFVAATKIAPKPSLRDCRSKADARFAAARSNWALVTCEILAAATRFSGEVEIPKEGVAKC
jgi:hypothetical protein